MKSIFQIKMFSGTGGIVLHLCKPLWCLPWWESGNVPSASAVHLLHVTWSVWKKSDLTQIRSWKKGGVFKITFSEICGCFSLMVHLGLTSGNFSKLSYIEESEITLVKFLKPISLSACIDLNISCFRHFEQWVQLVQLITQNHHQDNCP